MNTRFLTESEVEQRTGVSTKTLRRWRLENTGPLFRKFGSLVRYGDEDLTHWEDARVAGGDGVKKAPSSRVPISVGFRAAS